MIRRLLFVLAVCAALGSTAGATTTTTTTTLAAGASWVCSITNSWVAPDHYETVGGCTATGAYTNGGGDALGTSATAAATAQALCGSGNKTLVSVETTPSPTSGVPTANCGFNLSTFKYVCSVQATAADTSPMVEANFTSVVVSPFRFRAVCK